MNEMCIKIFKSKSKDAKNTFCLLLNLFKVLYNILIRIIFNFYLCLNIFCNNFDYFVFRTREELVKVISQLKSGEDVTPLFATTTNVNEDSSSAEIPPQLEVTHSLC